MAGAIKIFGMMSMLIPQASASCGGGASGGPVNLGGCDMSSVMFPDSESEVPSGSTKAECCADLCTGVTCPLGKTQRPLAFMLLAGSDPTTACCEPAKCDSHSCTTGSLKAGASDIEGYTDDTCCETRIGLCSGNTDSSDDFACPKGKTYTSSADGSFVKGSDEATCCETSCESHTCSSGMRLKAGASRMAGNTDEKCCQKLTCCNVECSKWEQMRKSDSETIAAETEAECCVDRAGMCIYNKDSSQDVDCGPGYHLKLGTSNIKGSTKDECCEADRTGMCALNTNRTEDVKCPADKTWKSNARDIKGTTESECCEAKMTGKCTGNSDRSADVKCDANQGYKVLTCANYDCGKYCSSEKGTCKMRTTSLAKNVALLNFVNQVHWCTTCCEPEKEGDASGAPTQAAVSAVLTLPAVLSLVN